MSQLTINEGWIRPNLWAPQFLEACRSGEEEKVLNLSTRSVHAVSSLGQKTLLEGLNILENNGQKDLADRLVSKIANHYCEHNSNGDKGKSCLPYMLLANRCYELASRLLMYGLNPCISHKKYGSSLNMVVMHRDFDWVKRLVEEYNHPLNGNGVLTSACNDKDSPIEIVQYLLSKGANPSEASNGGLISPIHSAVISNRYDILELLWENGADMNATFANVFGGWNTPEELAGDDETMINWLKVHPTKHFVDETSPSISDTAAMQYITSSILQSMGHHSWTEEVDDPSTTWNNHSESKNAIQKVCTVCNKTVLARANSPWGYGRPNTIIWEHFDAEMEAKWKKLIEEKLGN